MTIETVVQRVLDLSSRASHQNMPVRQRVIDALNELLQESAPQGRDAQAVIHDLADNHLDELVASAEQALAEPTKEEPTSEI